MTGVADHTRAPAAGDAADAGVVRAGSARRNITPAWPVLQAGFGQRQSASTGVLDPIFTKALYLEGRRGRLLVVTADLICIPAPLATAVTERIREHTGLSAHEICLCASHTHSAPVPWDAAGTAPGIAAWVPLLVQAMIEAACEAVDRAEPSRISTGVGRLAPLLNRRTRGQPNRVDPRVPVVAVESAASGQLTALLFGAGCHPVTLGWDSSAISGDFPGRAQSLLEAELGVRNALFFNSTEGNVIPATSPNRDALDPRGYCGGSDADTDYMAAALAAAVRAGLSACRSAGATSIGAARCTLSLGGAGATLDPAVAAARFDAACGVLRDALGEGFEDRVAPGALWAAASHHVIERDLDEPAMRRLMIACCHYLGLIGRRTGTASRPVEVPVQVLRIGDFALLALPGEVLVEVGELWQQRSGSDQAFVIGLANAHFRYLPLSSHFAEPDAGQHYETVTAGLEPQAMDKAIEAGRALLADLAH